MSTNLHNRFYNILINISNGSFEHSMDKVIHILLITMLRTIGKIKNLDNKKIVYKYMNRLLILLFLYFYTFYTNINSFYPHRMNNLWIFIWNVNTVDINVDNSNKNFFNKIMYT